LSPGEHSLSRDKWEQSLCDLLCCSLGISHVLRELAKANMNPKILTLLDDDELLKVLAASSKVQSGSCRNSTVVGSS